MRWDLNRRVYATGCGADFVWCGRKVNVWILWLLYIYIYMRGRGVGGRERYHSRKNLFLSGSDCCIYTVL